MMPALSVRYRTWPDFAFFTASATFGVTVPTFGFGMRPRGPRICPSWPTMRMASGLAITTSKSICPAFTFSARSSKPTMSAPAALAASAFLPWVNTATRTVLPVRVAVFTQGKNAEAAKAAGADIVGFEDLAEKVKAGQIDFDVVIASPDAMRIVGQLGQILGPRGLMPNPKVGTVTPNVAEAVKNAKSGQVRYRTDKAGIVHAQIGRANFEPSALKENLLALVNDLQKIKPATSKGVYLKKLTVSSTMGPGVAVDQSSLGLVKI